MVTHFYLFWSCPPTSAFLESSRDYDRVLSQTLLNDMLGGVHVLSEEELRQPASHAHLSNPRGFRMPSTTVLAHIAFSGFICAHPACT